VVCFCVRRKSGEPLLTLRLLEVVEIDALTHQLGCATIFVSSRTNFAGLRVEVEFDKGITILDSWPKWPEELSEQSAVWIAEPYIRSTEDGLVYSYGLRLDLSGRFASPISIDKWHVENRVLEVLVHAPTEAILVVGPFVGTPRLIQWRGDLRESRGKDYAYLSVRASEGEIGLKVGIGKQPLITGFVEVERRPGELPLRPIIDIKHIFKGRIIARLPDIYL